MAFIKSSFITLLLIFVSCARHFYISTFARFLSLAPLHLSVRISSLPVFLGGKWLQAPRCSSLTAPCRWQDLPRSPVAPPLDSCFLRPARPANRRPPSRWAARSPSSSPKWSEGSKRRFTFPPPGHRKTILEGEEPP